MVKKDETITEAQGNKDGNVDNPEIEVIDAEEKNEAGKTDSKATLKDSAELQQEIEKLEQEKDDVYERLLRIQAEYDNFKKRSQKEKESDRKYKAQDLVNELLPAMDNFERALQVEVTEETVNFVEGVSMVYRQLKDALKAQGVEEIESVGKEFDPNLHHAVMQIDDNEMESNMVVEELQKGYLLKDRVIRPAMVKVNK